MKKLRVIIVALLLTSLTIACAYQAPAQESTSSGKTTVRTPTVLYIPLDDRPVNYKNALELGQAAGFSLSCPSPEQLTTNAKLNNWLAEKTPQHEAAVVSVDMLLYGGLVESRKHNLEPDELSSRVNAIKSIKNNDNTVYAFVSVMRAPTANTPHTMPDYYARHGAQIFKYGALLDKSRLGTIEPAEAEKLSELTKAIPAEFLKDFTSRRDKNYQATEQVLELVRQGYIDRLLISKDDTSPHGFTRMEAEKLGKLVRQYNIADKVLFLTGTDECGQVLLAAMANSPGVGKVSGGANGSSGNDASNGASGDGSASDINSRLGGGAPRVYVDYACPSLAGNIPLYEDVPLRQNVALHIEAAGAAPAQLPGEADIVLALNNGSGNGEAHSEAADGPAAERRQFIDRIKSYTAQGIPVTIADVNYPNMADAGFMNTLNKQYDLSQLAGYSGWNTAGNSVGLALSQGTIAAGHAASDNPGAAQTKQSIILKSLLEDWGYQATVRPVIKEKVPAAQHTLITDPELERRITAEIEKMLNDFAEHNLREDFGNVNANKVNLPWHRLFDIDFDV